MKIIGVNGSPRKKATDHVVQEALRMVKEKYSDVETEYITLRNKKIAPCIGCDYCKREKDWCIFKDDATEIIQRIMEADALILGSAVYVMEPTPQLMALFSRMRPIHHVFPESLRHKFAVSIAVGGTRNGGQEIAVNTMNNMLLTRGFNVVSNEAFGYHGGKVWSKDNGSQGVDEDELGMKTVQDLVLKLAEITSIFLKGKENV